LQAASVSGTTLVHAALLSGSWPAAEVLLAWLPAGTRRAALCGRAHGGITPLHLLPMSPGAAVLLPALLASCPDAALLWFGCGADGGCTPAVLALRAGRGDLNAAALLTLERLMPGAARLVLQQVPERPGAGPAPPGAARPRPHEPLGPPGARLAAGQPGLEVACVAAGPCGGSGGAAGPRAAEAAPAAPARGAGRGALPLARLLLAWALPASALGWCAGGLPLALDWGACGAAAVLAAAAAAAGEGAALGRQPGRLSALGQAWLRLVPAEACQESLAVAKWEIWLLALVATAATLLDLVASMGDVGQLAFGSPAAGAAAASSLLQWQTYCSRLAWASSLAALTAAVAYQRYARTRRVALPSLLALVALVAGGYVSSMCQPVALLLLLVLHSGPAHRRGQLLPWLLAASVAAVALPAMRRGTEMLPAALSTLALLLCAHLLLLCCRSLPCAKKVA
jgi:hypothetical protein